MKKPQSDKVFFTQQDAWVFAAIKGAHDENGQFSLATLVQNGDVLNHSILSNGEVKQSLSKLAMRGLVSVNKENVELTSLAEFLYSRVENMRGGLFSVIENCLKVLNSPRTKLPLIEEIPNLEFIDKHQVGTSTST